MFKKILIVAAIACACGAVQATDLMAAWRAARSYDANFSAAENALAAGTEKSFQGDSLLLPQVAWSANINQASKSTVPGDPTSAPSVTAGPSYGWSLSVAQPLYDKAATASRDALKIQAQQAQVQFRMAEQDLILRVAKAYFDVLLAEESLLLVGAQKEAVAQQLAQAQKTFSVGSATITDTNEAQARFDALLAAEISTRNDLQVKRAALQQLTGMDPLQLTPVSVTREPTAPQPASLDAWLEQARTNSLLVIAQALGVRASDSEIARYRLESTPTVALVASVGDQWDSSGSAPSGSMDRTSSNSVGVVLTIPLYSGGYRSSKLREAHSLAALQRDTLEATVRYAQQLTRQSYLGVESGAAQVAALKQAMVSSATLVQSTTMGRDVGLRTTVDVLNAQQSHYQNIYNHIAARYQYLFSTLQLCAAVGTLTMDALEAANQWLAMAP